MKITEGQIRQIVREEILRESAGFDFHISRPNYRTLRLMVYDRYRGNSTYFEARDIPGAAEVLSQMAAEAGFNIPADEIEWEIEAS